MKLLQSKQKIQQSLRKSFEKLLFEILNLDMKW